MRLRSAVFIAGAFLSCQTAAAFDRSDREVKVEMMRRAALLCPGFSNESAFPGINGIKVDALRVLLSRDFTVCPDKRLSPETGAIWYSRYGVFVWNPASAKSVVSLSNVIDGMTHTGAFPDELSVFDAEGKAMKNQVVPSFQPRETFTHF